MIKHSIPSALTFFACVVAALVGRRSIGSDHIGDGDQFSMTCGVAVLLVMATLGAARHAATARQWRRGLNSSLLTIGLVLLTADYYVACAKDLSVGLADLVVSESRGNLPILFVGFGGRDVRLVGELTEGTARRLDLLLRDNPNVERIHLTSEGGLAEEGLAMGEIIAAHHLTTFVPDYCVSACTLPFVRGSKRLILANSRLGFHAPYEQGVDGTLYQDDSSDIRAAYLAAGLSAEFVQTALRTASSDIWLPTIDQLRSAHVITAIAGDDDLPDSSLDDNATAAGARTFILQNVPELASLDKQAPKAVNLVAAWYLDRYRHGRSEGENVEALRAIASGSVAFVLAGADDAIEAEVACSLAGAIGRSHDATLCNAIGGNLDVVAAAKLLGRTKSSPELLDRALTHHAPDAWHADSSLPPKGRWLPQATCAGWRATFADLLARPPRQLAQALRARFSDLALRDLTRRPVKAAARLCGSFGGAHECLNPL